MFRLDMQLEGEIVVISLNGNFEKFNTMEVIEKVEQTIITFMRALDDFAWRELGRDHTDACDRGLWR